MIKKIGQIISRFSTKSMELIKACGIGNLEKVKVIYYPNVHGSDIIQASFIKSCEKGRLRVAQWLVTKGANIFSNDNEALMISCEQGHLHIAQWLFKMGLNLFSNDNRAIRKSCENGRLDVVQWLIIMGARSNIDRHILISLTRGHLLIFTNVPCSVRVDQISLAFICINDHLRLASWLSTESNIDVRPKILEAFNNSIILDQDFRNKDFRTILESLDLPTETIELLECVKNGNPPDICENNEYVIHLFAEYKMFDQLEQLRNQNIIDFDVCDDQVVNVVIRRPIVKSARKN